MTYTLELHEIKEENVAIVEQQHNIKLAVFIVKLIKSEKPLLFFH